MIIGQILLLYMDLDPEDKNDMDLTDLDPQFSGINRFYITLPFSCSCRFFSFTHRSIYLGLRQFLAYFLYPAGYPVSLAGHLDTGETASCVFL